MAATVDRSRDSRLTAAEVEIVGIKRGIGELQKAIDALAVDLHGIGNKLSSAGKTNWQTLFAGFGVVLVLLAMYGQSIVSPLSVRVGAAETLIADAAKALHDIQIRQSHNIERLSEVETQFRAIGMQAAWYNRMDALLWRKVFGEDLPELHSINVGAQK